jgi:hypothetical protein
VLSGLAGAVDNFRKTPPNLTMVVETCETQILERQMPKFLDCLLDIQLIVLDLLQ